MLRVVAGETRKHFDTEYIYRIGGDEFILFIPDADEENLKIQCEKLAAALSSFDYYISVGIQCGKNISSMSELIREAEKKMYADKRKYYEEYGQRRNQEKQENDIYIKYSF